MVLSHVLVQQEQYLIRQTKSLGYVNIATLGNSIDFGTLVNANKNQSGALSSTTRGIWEQVQQM